MKILLAIWLLALPNLAFAYIDPGSGAYFLQLLMALVGAVVFYITHPAQLIKYFLEKLRALKEWFKP